MLHSVRPIRVPAEAPVAQPSPLHDDPEASKLLTHLSDLHRRDKLALIFDIDQTLADPIPGIHEGFDPLHRQDHLLVDMHDQTSGATALVTGRPLRFIENAFPQFSKNMIAATEFGGLIVETRHGALTELERSHNSQLTALHQGLSRVFVRHATALRNCEIEKHKVASITVACTKAPVQEDALQVLRSYFGRVVNSMKNSAAANPLVMTSNAAYDNCTVDVMPATANKGIAKRRIISHSPAFQGRCCAVFGDSASDVAMMKVALENDGVAVWVGNKLPPSDFQPTYRLRDSETVTAIVEQVSRCRAG